MPAKPSPPPSRYLASRRALALLTLALLLGAVPPGRGEQPTAWPSLRIETGQHTAIVRSVAADAAGRFVATASEDKTVRLWDAQTGELLRVFRPPIGPGDEGKLYAVALSPDATWLIVGGWTDPDGQKQSLYVFERATGRLHRRIAGLPDVVNRLAVSADGARVAAGLGSGGVRVFRLPGGEPLFSDADYGADCNGVDFAQDGRLVTSSYDGLIRLYSAAHRRIAKVPALGGKEPFRVRFSPDGGRIAVDYNDSPRVDVLDAGSLKPLSWRPDVTGVDHGNLFNVAWSSAGQRLCAAGRYFQGGQAVMRCWNQGGQGTREDLPLVKSTIMDLWALPNGQMAYAAGDASWGVVKGKSQAAAVQAGSIADLRGLGDGFRLDASGQRVRFAFRYGSGEPVEFSLADRALVRRPKEDAALQPPRQSGLKIEGWEDTTAVTVEGKPLQLDPYETSRSLAIAGDGSGFVLGTEWWLRRYGRDGKQAWSQPIPDVAWAVNVSRDGRLIVAGLGDGTVRWYRSRDGQELLALFAPADDSGRWVLWTPAGYYDAGPKSEDLIGFHIDRARDQAADFVPAVQLSKLYRKPEVISRALAGKIEEPPTNLQASLPPAVNILSPEPVFSHDRGFVTLHVTARSLSQAPLSRLQVLVDGSRLVDEALVGARLDEQLYLIVPVPPRDSTVAVMATTPLSQFGEPARVRMRWTGQAAADPTEDRRPQRQLYVLAVGVTRYSDAALNTLKFPADDARAVAAALKRQEGGLFSKVHTHVLTDGQATKAGIERELEWLEKSATDNDVAVVFLAGHGRPHPRNSSEYLYQPWEASEADIKPTHLAASELVHSLSQMHGLRVLFLDTCFAGKAAPGAARSGRLDLAINELARAENGAVVYAGASDSQLAYENAEWRHGAFTRALLEALGSEAVPNEMQTLLRQLRQQGILRIGALNHYLAERVKALTSGQQAVKHAYPSKTIPDDFPLALIRER